MTKIVPKIMFNRSNKLFSPHFGSTGVIKVIPGVNLGPTSVKVVISAAHFRQNGVIEVKMSVS